jgi:hypothetical protein
MLGVDEVKIVAEQSHPEPMTAVLRMGAEERQIVVRLTTGMRRVESLSHVHEKRIAPSMNTRQNRE